jgi:hypothetical protein
MLYLFMSKGSADLNVLAPKVAESPEKRETRLGKNGQPFKTIGAYKISIN